MDNHNRASACRNSGFDLLWIEIERRGFDVREHGPCAKGADGAARRDKCKRRDDYFIALPHPTRVKPEFKGFRP